MNFTASNDYYGDGRYIQREMTQRHIGKLLFRTDDDVLDVGCGTGEETKSVAANVRSVTGTCIHIQSPANDCLTEGWTYMYVQLLLYM